MSCHVVWAEKDTHRPALCPIARAGNRQRDATYYHAPKHERRNIDRDQAVIDACLPLHHTAGKEDVSQ